MGVFEDEEVVSGRVCGNPVGKLLRLRGLGVNQLDGLFLYIQPLQHNTRQNFSLLHTLFALFATLFAYLTKYRNVLYQTLQDNLHSLCTLVFFLLAYWKQVF